MSTEEEKWRVSLSKKNKGQLGRYEELKEKAELRLLERQLGKGTPKGKGKGKGGVTPTTGSAWTEEAKAQRAKGQGNAQSAKGELSSKAVADGDRCVCCHCGWGHTKPYPFPSKCRNPTCKDRKPSFSPVGEQGKTPPASAAAEEETASPKPPTSKPVKFQEGPLGQPKNKELLDKRGWGLRIPPLNPEPENLQVDDTMGVDPEQPEAKAEGQKEDSEEAKKSLAELRARLQKDVKDFEAAGKDKVAYLELAKKQLATLPPAEAEAQPTLKASTQSLADISALEEQQKAHLEKKKEENKKKADGARQHALKAEEQLQATLTKIELEEKRLVEQLMAMGQIRAELQQEVSSFQAKDETPAPQPAAPAVPLPALSREVMEKAMADLGDPATAAASPDVKQAFGAFLQFMAAAPPPTPTAPPQPAAPVQSSQGTPQPPADAPPPVASPTLAAGGAAAAGPPAAVAPASAKRAESRSRSPAIDRLDRNGGVEEKSKDEEEL
jgi:DNA repair exonuclease SbcCD ATPase subunit